MSVVIFNSYTTPATAPGATEMVQNQRRRRPERCVHQPQSRAFFGAQ